MIHERQWLNSLVGRCQLLAGRIVERPSPKLISDLRPLTAALPDALSLPEQLLVRGLLSRLLGRILWLADLERHPEVLHAFVAWGTSMSPSGTLHSEWSRLVECCVDAMNETRCQDAWPRDVPDSCVRRVLGDIHARYQDPKLSLSAVAKNVNLSPSHVTRILKRRTGYGFVAHLRRVRVSAARLLLVQSHLSVKEIAAAVGYAHPNQLDRHCMHMLGMTPSSFRRSARRSLAS